MDRLRGKRAFVTGAGAGIGRAVTLAFLAEGAHVVATDARGNALDGIGAHAQLETIVLDVSDTSAISAIATTLDPMDIIVNCAAIVHHGTVLNVSEADWERCFTVNVTSVHRIIAALLPGMLASGGGSIINVGSTVSSIRGVPNRYVYGTTKASLIGLTKAVAADFIRQAIRCNAICPGTVESESLNNRIATQAAAQDRPEAEIRQAFIDRQPMGRLGTPEEIAALAVYLGSDESRFTTGQIHIIDGGFTL